MVCYKPLVARYGDINPKTGKRFVKVLQAFNTMSDQGLELLKPQMIDEERFLIPCGQCIGCRLERSRQWAVRCSHEASLYGNDNCFITLTFNDDNLNSSRSLVVADFQKFMKRLRKKYKGLNRVVDTDTGLITYPIRFFHCGEYGSRLMRPHHHACLFNFDFDDKVLWQVRNGVRLYRSAKLEELWTYGFCTVGAVTFESAAYVARYIMKKQTGRDVVNYYGDRKPEYTTMSRRPGIARRWIDKYIDDVYPQDYVVIRNDIKCKPPKYYDSVYELTDIDGYDIVKQKRKLYILDADFVEERRRLEVKRQCKEIALNKLLRVLHY